MTTIHSDERGQIIQVTDVYGTYFYVADDFGQPASDGFNTEDRAWEEFEADHSVEVAGDTHGTISLDERGRRIIECAYCHTESFLEGAVPTASDDAAWEELSTRHADDCEWVMTRAHRRES